MPPSEDPTRASRWFAASVGLVVSLGSLVTLAGLVWPHPDAGPVVLEEGAPLVVDKAALRQVDLEQVHAELVPSWVVAQGAMRGMQLDVLRKEVRPDRSLLAIIERIVSPLGRRIDESQPYVDARLADGSRVNAVIHPLSLVGPCLTIRKFSKTPGSTFRP